MIVKIMKGDENFRNETNAAALCLNELHIYRDVIPYFQKFLVDINIKAFDPHQWVPKVYFADAKIIEELGDNEETILVMENLTPKHFRMGPRVDLDEPHLELMAKLIASYHSVSYAMRINQDPMLEKLVKGLIPYSFFASDGSVLDAQQTFYKTGLKRVFNCVIKDEKLHANKKFIQDVKNLKKVAFEHPLKFMESFLAKDEVFSIILHGDYNRNNVLFHYMEPDGYDEPTDIRMIDFQEVRYGTPAIDISFFMYMNMPGPLREEYWDKLLKIYHKTLLKCLRETLNCYKDDPRLKPYSYENFIAHFNENALYGAVVAMVFIPMMACPEDECARLTELYDNDFLSKELEELTLSCGGRNVDNRLIEILQHASKKGYLDILK